MDPDFWHERWKGESIGFHQPEINTYLKKYIDELMLAPGDRIFVPLCGKTLDMWWLYEQGFKVIGIELSEIAVNSFFTEAGKQARTTKSGDFVSWKFAGMEILCGDYFKLDADQLGDIDAVFDRAALIALPAEMRTKYVEKLSTLLPVNAHGLLVTLNYPQLEMSGPPFSVSKQEVETLYAAKFNINQIEDRDVIEENSRFRERGITRLHENIYRFHRR